ncbi:MAG TPA: transporter [Gemmatimonadales bacterium]|nr:transporter [Gemmatimonadales bacterium]
MKAVSWLVFMSLAQSATAQTTTPLSGHYPPGQSGIRGAATPDPGFSYTNFSRFFTNLEVRDASGQVVGEVGELRYANISMITWTTATQVLGMRYGALAGVPFATGNLQPSGDDTASSGFGLGDILLTPVSLYGKSHAFDYQFQFTVWSASGHFEPGSAQNRGTGFWALVYSIGGVYYPGAGGGRDAWSVSAVARIEQNFEQKTTHISPGDDIVIDWGIGRVVRAGPRRVDVGASGFGTWQITAQNGGTNVDTHRYRYLGAGPEASISLSGSLGLRVRAHWEFASHNAVRGDNLWVILNYRW